MNTAGIALVWCAVQVTLIAILCAGLYLAVRSLKPPAAGPIVLTGLLSVVALSGLVFSPWPRWPLEGLAPASRAGLPEEDVGVLRSTGEAARPGSQEQPRDGLASVREGVDADGHLPPALPRQPLFADVPPTAPAEAQTGWPWPAAAAALFLASMAAGVAWLLLGLLAVRRRRTAGRAVGDRELLDTVDALRAALGCRRPIEVRECDDLVTAATIGWRRPIILLPPQWPAWTVPQRHAVLAHEIAHARSHDFLALVCGQIGLALHFYHPLVHWLVNRLRLEQEVAADAAAARVAGGQREYLATIAELALRQEERPMAWPARSFLPAHSTLFRRIAMLRDSKVRFGRLSRAGRLVAVGVVLLCGLLAAGLRGPSWEPSGMAEASDAKPAAAKAGLNLLASPARVAAEPAPAAPPKARAGTTKSEKGTDLKATYRADFGKANFDHEKLVPVGMDSLYGWGLLQPEPRGLRTVIPHHQGDTKPFIGFSPQFKIAGDFEITVSYEVLATEAPPRDVVPADPGADLYILQDKTLDAAYLRRCVLPTGYAAYGVFSRVRRDSTPQSDWRYFPAETRLGKLRLVRTGATLQYWVADGEAGPFRKLHEVEFGNNPVGFLRIGAVTGGLRVTVDALWQDVTIRAAELRPVDIPLLRHRPRAQADAKSGR